MALSSGKDAQPFQTKNGPALADFPTSGRFESPEQIRRFELLRLAFFALKLRKLEQHAANGTGVQDKFQGEIAFRCNLLRHVIFQQVLTLIRLDAREQALQIIAACRNRQGSDGSPVETRGCC
jgi:hypothetical protein